MPGANGKKKAKGASERHLVGADPAATERDMATHTRKTPAKPNLGLRIEVLRRRRSLTQDQLGKLMGTTGSNISHWESARYVPPTEVIPKLAEVLGTTLSWLMGEHVTDEETGQREEAILRLLLDGGSRLVDLLDRFPSVDALIAYLESFEAKPKT